MPIYFFVFKFKWPLSLRNTWFQRWIFFINWINYIYDFLQSKIILNEIWLVKHYDYKIRISDRYAM